MRLPVGRRRGAGTAEHRRVVAEVDGDAVEAGADPDDLARGAERVELLGPVAGDAARQHVRLPQRDRERQRPAAARAPRAGSRAGRSRASAGRKRPSAACSAGSTSRRSAASEARRRRRRTSGSHHSRSVPPGRSSPRTSFSSRSSSSSSGSTSRPKRAFASAVVNGPRPRAKRSTSWRQGLRAALEEDVGQPARRHRAERVAVAARVLGGDQPLLARDPDPDGAPLGDERLRERRVVARPARRSPRRRSRSCSSSGRPGRPAQLRLDVGERVRVEQVAQLLLAEQLAEEVAVERERLGPPLRRRRVVLVHVRGDVVEQERRRERRGGGGLDVDEVDCASLQPVQEPLQRGQVEDVLEALAVGLEHDRERAVAAGDLQQVCALRRCCQSGVRCPGRRRGISSARAAFSRKRAPKSAVCPTSCTTSSSISSGPIASSPSGGGASASGRWIAIPSSDQIDCTSTPSESRRRAASASAHGAWTRAPNGVRMQTRQSPISSRKRSTTTVRSEGTAPVAAACSRRKASRLPAARSSRKWRAVSRSSACGVGERDELARGAADRLAELVGPPDPLALPERHRPGHPGRRRDEHPVAGDLLDPPARGAEQEHLARARLVDHLLVQLADAPAALDEEDAEEAAVGDRARVRDREPAHSGARRARRPPVRSQTMRGPQLGELVGGVAAGEHVEHVLELDAGEVGERVRAADEVVAARRRRSPRRRRSRRSAGRARRAGCAGSRVSSICALGASARRRRPTRAGRPGTSGRCGPSRRRRARGRRGRSAGARARPTSGSRPGSRGRRRPCRSRARATRSRRGTGSRRASAAPRSRRAARGRGEPWWARASSRPASSFSRSASRSARRRLLTKTIVERWASTSWRISG